MHKQINSCFFSKAGKILSHRCHSNSTTSGKNCTLAFSCLYSNPAEFLKNCSEIILLGKEYFVSGSWKQTGYCENI